MGIEELLVDGDVVPPPREQEVLGGGAGELEPGAAVDPGALTFHLAMAPPPVRAVQGDLGVGQGPAGGAGAGGDLPRSVHLPHDQHQVAHHQVDSEEAVGVLFEVAPGGRHHQVGAGAVHGRRGVGEVGAVVGGRRQLDAPLRVRRMLDDLGDLALRRQQVVVLGLFHPGVQVVAPGAEVQGVEVAVGDPDRALAGPVQGHGGQREVGGFDGGGDVGTAPAADAVGVALGSGQGGPPRLDQAVGLVRALQQLRQYGLPLRPPGQAVVEPRQGGLEGSDDGAAILLRLEGGVQPAQALQARLQGGLGLSVREVPGLQIGEDRADLRDRVDLRVGQVQRVGRVRITGEQLPQVEPVGLLGLSGPPQGGVGELLDPEVGHRVPQGPADPGRVVVLLDVPGEPADGGVAPFDAPGERRVKGAVGLGHDLVQRPLLQVDLVVRHHLLPLPDLPAVGVDVGHQGVGVGELEDRALERFLGPVLPREEAHCPRIAVQGGAELHLLDQGAGPLVGVTG